MKIRPGQAMALRIPERHKSIIQNLFAMTEESREALLRALEKAQPAPSPSVLANSFQAETNLDRETSKGLVEFFTGMYWARDIRDVPLADFVDRVCEAIQAFKDAELRPADGDWNRFKEYLKRILSFEDSLGVAAKASDVMREYEHTYCEARILTDIRSVFKPNVEDKPAAGVIMHILRLRHHEGRELRDFFVALDSEDLADLLRILRRAQAKESSLKKLLAESAIPHVEVPHREV